MTESIVQRLRETAATLPAERVSMQTLAHAHGPAAHGTWLLLMAVPASASSPRRYTPRNTLNSRNSRTGSGVSSFHTMLIGRSPSADSSATRPQAR